MKTFSLKTVHLFVALLLVLALSFSVTLVAPVSAKGGDVQAAKRYYRSAFIHVANPPSIKKWCKYITNTPRKKTGASKNVKQGCKKIRRR